MAKAETCPDCGAPIRADAPFGFCAQCLLDVATNTATQIGASLRGLGERSSDQALTPEPRPDRRSFGDYEMLEEIARGGMGIVYKARQVSLDRIVAVKLILAGAAASKEFIHRFRTEAAAAANLQHPNIVAVHEVGTHQGENYLVMDFVDGPNLARFVGQQPLPAQRAARCMKLIAEAIHYAHERGILHRDLKPSNVLIDPATDQPRVTDFGLAKRFGVPPSGSRTAEAGTAGEDLTLTGQVLGSPNFMAPEQAAGAKGKVSRRTDVYGLGAILYHLLTARPPLQAESLPETLQQVAHTEPLPPRLLNPGVPRDLETICLKCLEKEPEKRYATGKELGDELTRFLDHVPIHARPVTRVERAWRWCRRKPALATAIGVAAVSLLVLAIGSPLVALHFKHARQETAAQLYAADIHGANEALRERDLVRARHLLEQIASSEDQRGLRGWEWRYLMGQCRSDEIAVLHGHQSWLEGVALSPDDKLLASISGDGVVKLWDCDLRKEIRSWRAHVSLQRHRPFMPAHAVLFLPGTSLLATSGADGFIRLWKTGSTNALASFGNAVNAGEPLERRGSLTCSADGQLLAAGSLEGWVSLWNLSGEKPERLSHWLKNKGMQVRFLPDGRLAVSGSDGLRLWDVSDPRQPKEHSTLIGRQNMDVSPDGRRLVSQSAKSDSFMFWDLQTGAPTRFGSSLGANAFALRFSPDGRSLVSSPGDERIVLWDLQERQAPVTLVGHEDFVWRLAFTSDGKMLASASVDHTVRLWDVSAIWSDSEERLPMVRRGIKAATVAFSPDSRLLACLSVEPRIEFPPANESHTMVTLWDVTTRTEVAAATSREPTPDGRLAFSPDGRTLAVEDGGTIQFYAVPSLQALTNWPGQRPAYSRDGSMMVYARVKTILRRDTVSSAEVTIGEAAAEISALELSPDAATAVTSDAGGSIAFWKVREPGAPVRADLHQDQVWSMAFSPDGQTLASASWDMRLGLWDVKNRRNLELLRAHKGDVWSVGFSPDGRTVATGGNDMMVRLWNLRTRRELAALRGHSAVVKTVVFSPDGRWLVSGDMSGAIRFWHAPELAGFATTASSRKE